MGLARMRAVQGWCFILLFPIVIASVVFGPPNAALALLVVFVFTLVIAIAELRVAGEGKRWRSENGIE